MGKVALFGAGQAGAMVARLMGPGHSVCCVADNDGRKWGGSLCGAPVVPPERALEYAPESFIICVMGEERSAQMEGQLRELGYAGPVLRASGLGMLDARSAVMRLLAEQMELLGIEGDVAELGTTVLVVTHEKELVNAFSKRVVAIDDGHVISDGMDVYYNYE